MRSWVRPRRQQRRLLPPVPIQFAGMALDWWPAISGPIVLIQIVTPIPMTGTFGLGTNSQVYDRERRDLGRVPTHLRRLAPRALTTHIRKGPGKTTFPGSTRGPDTRSQLPLCRNSCRPCRHHVGC